MISPSKLMLIGLLALVSLNASAIVDIENIRMTSPDQRGLAGETHFQAAGSAGNSENTVLTFKNNMIWLLDESEWMLLFRYRYGESLGIKNANQGFLHLRYTQPILVIADHWELYTQADKDEFRALLERSLVGSNLKWSVYKTDSTRVSVALGAFAYRERLDTEFEDWQEDEGARVNSYVSLATDISENASVGFSLYYQPKVSDSDDTHALANLSIETKLVGDFDTTISAEYRYDSEPPPSIEDFDLTYTAGIKYSY